MTTPALPDVCWPIDSSCCTGWDQYPPEVQDRASAMAVTTLRSLTGYRVGGCPVTVRPCRDSCNGYGRGFGFYGMYGYTFVPTMDVNGSWINISCGCISQNCDCAHVCEVQLPAPVTRVDSVQIDSEVLPTAWYRIDNGNKLVWTGPDDLDCWPLCQDMTAPVGDPNTFAVTYLNSLPVDGLGAYVAGVLSCEFAKACSGQKCRLPAGVTAVVRQGVAFTVGGGMAAANAFTSPRTGILEVDAWLRAVNPHGLIQPPQVWSPDQPRSRVTTWSP